MGFRTWSLSLTIFCFVLAIFISLMRNDIEHWSFSEKLIMTALILGFPSLSLWKMGRIVTADK